MVIRRFPLRYGLFLPTALGRGCQVAPWDALLEKLIFHDRGPVHARKSFSSVSSLSPPPTPRARIYPTTGSATGWGWGCYQWYSLRFDVLASRTHCFSTWPRAKKMHIGASKTSFGAGCITFCGGKIISSNVGLLKLLPVRLLSLMTRFLDAKNAAPAAVPEKGICPCCSPHSFLDIVSPFCPLLACGF